MNIRTSVLAGIAVIGGIGALLATNAESQVGVVKESVALQSANPGFSQSGNSNISGTARAGTFYGANLTVTAGAAAGKVLKSDASGNATWQTDSLTVPASFIGSIGPFEALIAARNESTQAGVNALYGQIASQDSEASAIMGLSGGNARGVYGIGGTGVLGLSSSSTGAGILGRNSNGGLAGKFEGKLEVTGQTSIGTTLTNGVLTVAAVDNHGIRVTSMGANAGAGLFATSLTNGVEGESSTPTYGGGFFTSTHNQGFGVLGRNISASGGTGVVGLTTSANGIGVKGEALAGGLAGLFDGRFIVTGATSIGTNAHNGLLTLVGSGADVLHITNSGTGRGMYINSPADTALWANTSTGIAGIDARNARTDGYGLIAVNSHPTGTGMGVAGSSSSVNGWGVFAFGRSGASGTKSFRIDHPLDPANKFLYHYASESPEPINFYTGIVTTNAKGEAWVTLPDYFESINRDFRYTLTVVDDTDSDEFVLAKVAKKIQSNRFKIRTSVGNVEVSWRIDAVRNDRFVQEYGAPVEQEKPENMKGRYQHPELYELGPESGMLPRQNVSEKPKK